MNSKGPGARPWIRRAPINIAVTGSPGIPKVIIGIRAPPVTALLADSGAAMPWGDPLPKEIIRYFRKHREIPKYLKNNSHKMFFDIDKKMKILSSNLNVKYQSPMSILCNEQGCLTRIDNSKNSITAWDESHLTEKGSIYLINKFYD